MSFLRIFSIVFIFGLVNGARDTPDLPVLRNNILLPSPQNELAGAKVIDCIEGPKIETEFESSGYSYNPNPSKVLTEYNFKHYPFTSKGPAFVRSPVGTEAEKFSFVKMVHGSVMVVYVLQSGQGGESAYWLPQGRSLDIPQKPKPGQPRYVFTPDFTGCSWLVTPMTNGKLRIRHVEGSNEGSKENAQFNNQDKGGNTTYAMLYKDYGYIQDRGQTISVSTAYAYMHYDGTRWTLYVQQKTCPPEVGQTIFDKNGKIDKMKMNYYNQHRYNLVSKTKAFQIPLHP